MVHPTKIVDPSSALLAEMLVPELFHDSSKISSIVSKVLSESPTEPGRSVVSSVEKESRQEAKNLDDALEFVEMISNSPQPLAESVLQVLMTTDVVEKFQKESIAVKKGHDFFGYLIKQSEETIDYKKHVEKTMKGGALLEKVSGVTNGPLESLYKGAGKVFSKMDFAGEILNALSLMECSATRCFKLAVYFSAVKKLKELETQLSRLPEADKQSRDVLQVQIQRLDTFIKIEQKTLIKALPSELLSMTKQGLGVAKWALDLAKEAVGATEPAAKSITTAVGSLGLVTSAIGVCTAGFSLGKGIYKHVQYGKWLEQLQNELEKNNPELVKEAKENDLIDTFVVEAASRFQERFQLEMSAKGEKVLLADIEKNVTSQFPKQPLPIIKKIGDQIFQRCQRHLIYQNALTIFEMDPAVCTPSKDLATRTVALQDLRKRVSAFLKDQCKKKGISDSSSFVSISTHALLRKFVYAIDVKLSGSPEKAAQSQLMTSSLKSGLTNLALRKHEVERRHHRFTLGLLSGKFFLAALALVSGILIITACIAPPISTFISLGILAGGMLIAAAGAFYLYKTKPDLFKATWGSLDGWLLPFRQVIAKFRGWRLAMIELQKEQLERKLAPTCYKIVLLEHLKNKDFEKMKVDCPVLGVTAGATRKETKDAIEKQIIFLKTTITDKDKLKLVSLQQSRDVVSKKLKVLEAKISEMDAKLRKISLMGSLEHMKKDKDWRHVDSLLSDCKEAVVDNLVDGISLCVPVLEELNQTTGIAFNPSRIEEKIEVHKRSLKAARLKGMRARQKERHVVSQEHEARVSYEHLQEKMGPLVPTRMNTRVYGRNKAELAKRKLALEKALDGSVRARKVREKAHEAKMKVYQPLLEELGAPIASFLEREEQDLTKLLSQ